MRSLFEYDSFEDQLRNIDQNLEELRDDVHIAERESMERKVLFVPAQRNAQQYFSSFLGQFSAPSPRITTKSPSENLGENGVPTKVSPPLCLA